MVNDVFICHSSKDRDIAMTICGELEREDIKCWIAPRDVVGGKAYAREIVEAIKGSAVVVFIFSESSNASNHVENEIDASFCEGKVIIPFRIDTADMNEFLKYYLNKKHWLDLSEDLVGSVAKLKEMIIANIPEKARDMQVHDALKIVQDAISDSSISDGDMMGLKLSLKELKASLDMDDNDSESSNSTDIFKNDNGDILVVMDYLSGGPENPRLIYDGGSKAILYRSKETAIVLRNISEAAREAILAVSQVKMVEVDGDDVLREYDAEVKPIKSVEALALSIGVKL